MSLPSNRFAVVSQGILNTVSPKLKQETPLRRKRSPSIENKDCDKPYYSDHQSRRQVRSTSNLETEFFQGEEPQPTPRRSLSGSSRPSSTSSPKPQPTPRRSLSGSGRPSSTSSPKLEPTPRRSLSGSGRPSSTSSPKLEPTPRRSLSGSGRLSSTSSPKLEPTPRRSLSGSGRPSSTSSPKLEPTPRRSLSGSGRPFSTSSTKPQPTPRRSLPSSPSGSGRPSPNSSPKSQPCSVIRHSWSTHTPTHFSLPPAELCQTSSHQKYQQQEECLAFWVCDYCTYIYINPDTLPVCEVCGRPYSRAF